MVLVTGAARGIGAAIARRLAAEGAHVVLTDIDDERTKAVAAEIEQSEGAGRAAAVSIDVTDEEAVAAAFEKLRLTYGGVDILISNAGVAHVAPLDALTMEDWQHSLAVNTTGHFLVAREAMRIFKDQGTGGAMVFVATKNVPAPGKDFGAYSVSKAAEAQLARVLAIEGGEFGVRVNMINPDAVFEDSGLWSDELKEQRAASYGIEVDGLEGFYQQRNLLRAHNLLLTPAPERRIVLVDYDIVRRGRLYRLIYFAVRWMLFWRDHMLILFMLKRSFSLRQHGTLHFCRFFFHPAG